MLTHTGLLARLIWCQGRALMLSRTWYISQLVEKHSVSYYMWRQKLTVKNENRVGRRGEVEELLTTLVFLLGDRLALGDSFPPSIYAFLPTEMVTNFPFIIQGDFILASSRWYVEPRDSQLCSFCICECIHFFSEKDRCF